MLPVFAKIKAPAFGWGKVKLAFTGKFKALSPEAQMSILQQVMVQCRDAHRHAEREHKSKLAHEDARNANSIRVRA